MPRIEDYVEGTPVVYRRCPGCNCRTPEKEPTCEECGGRFCIRCHGEGMEASEQDPVRWARLVTDLADLARTLPERHRAELVTRLTETDHTDEEE